jgi:NADH-quinone oxidoreductase subunit N
MVNNPDLLKFNLIIYIFAILNIFIILLFLENLYEKEIDNFEQIKGLFHINPFLALSLTISIFSIAAIPPLPGFFAKYQLLIFAYGEFHIALFAIIIITSVLAVANYIKLYFSIKVIFILLIKVLSLTTSLLIL